MRRLLLLALVSTVVLAYLTPCITHAAGVRLGHEVVPIAESVRLDLDPGRPDYRGSVVVTLRVRTPVDFFQLNARELTIEKVNELAHMWFGDLVTMKWWDDLWLNESFASWLGGKTTHEVHPEFQMPILELSGTTHAMDSDARLSTRAIRQPVAPDANLHQTFDELTYLKGQSLLGMLERWIGAEPFRQGVSSYMRRHRWGSTEAADLWTALGSVRVLRG
jgi:aminopeptidase N